MSELVAGNAKGGKEEKRVKTTRGSEVALTEDVSALAYTINTLSMYEFVVLECHIVL